MLLVHVSIVQNSSVVDHIVDARSCGAYTLVGVGGETTYAGGVTRGRLRVGVAFGEVGG